MQIEPIRLCYLFMNLIGNLSPLIEIESDIEMGDTYRNRPDCDTSDMVSSQIVNMVQFFRCLLDKRIHPTLEYTLARIAGIGALKADVSYKQLFDLGRLSASIDSQLDNTNGYRDP